jgi:diguanylate cyclase (GGDEF)-like protein
VSFLRRKPRNLSSLNLSAEDQQRLAFPAIFVGLALCLYLLISSLFPGLPLINRRVNIGIGLTGMLYIVLAFFIILPYFKPTNPILQNLSVFFNAAIVTIPIFLQSYLSNGVLLIAITILMVSSAVLAGRWPTYFFILLTTAIHFFLGRLFSINNLSDVGFEIIFTVIVTILVTETITMMKQAISIQIQRLETLNRIAHDLSSSLEMHQVINLVSNAIQTILDADTYYLGLMQEDTLKLELLYDEGEFFPNVEMYLENSLAGWVITNARPLLMRDVTAEAREKLNIKVSTIGKPKVSHSWMGVPLEASGRIFGVVAVASYLKNQFAQSDLELLQNVTQQAAMALDNASHHSQVEDQSRRDTLTATLNHGAFLKALAYEISTAKSTGQSLGLIMLDIDKFKDYNDHFGHLVGDQVLVAICDAIRLNIKGSDLIGRWGGEEFVIALPQATGAQAIQVANRIRHVIGEIALLNRDQKPIPAPTICQGIAMFPQEASDTIGLIDLADQRLYEAKDKGQNQIEPERDAWIVLNNELMIRN